MSEKIDVSSVRLDGAGAHHHPLSNDSLISHPGWSIHGPRAAGRRPCHCDVSIGEWHRLTGFGFGELRTTLCDDQDVHRKLASFMVVLQIESFFQQRQK